MTPAQPDRESLEREIEAAIAAIERSRTRLGVNQGTLIALAGVVLDNQDVLLAALRPAEPDAALAGELRAMLGAAQKSCRAWQADWREAKDALEAAECARDEALEALDAIQADVEMLRVAVKNSDPKAEIQVRCSDILAFVLARAAAILPQPGQPDRGGRERWLMR